MTTTVKGKDIDGKMVVLKRTQPEQLTLFQHFLEDARQYSNTVELYDLMPKYVASPRKISSLRQNGKFLDILVRSFKHRNQNYTLEITPARLLTKERETKDFYPTEREQLVEEALRKIACDHSNGYYLNDNAGVQFTLSQLRQELERLGHSIRYDNLVEALKIANKTNITLSTADGETLVAAPIFPVLIKRSRKEWLTQTTEAHCYVQFNPLVTTGINQLTYRQHNYDKFMNYQRQLSRWLHKRLYNLFIQANVTDPYTIKASTIIRDSGLVCNTQERDRFIAIEAALEELKNQKIISTFSANKIQQGRKVVDVRYTIYAAGEFIMDTVFGNRRKKLQTAQANHSKPVIPDSYLL